ncbi:MAG: hypothetical protein AAFO82_11660, partial [Bacteroidota bacterium]
IMYAATDDHDSWFNNNRGVLKSTDGGATWNIVGLPNTQANNVFKLMIHPSGSPLYACTNTGLFESNDGGENWERNAALPENVNDLEFHPNNSQVMYATTRGGASPNRGYFYVSTDGGSTFMQKTATLDSKGRTTEVAVSPNNPNIAYIGVYPEPPNYTTTGGMVMQYTHSTGNIVTRTDPSYVFPNIWVGGAWNFRIAVNPNDANHVIYGSVFTYESKDGGVTWSYLPVPHADLHDVKWQAGTDRLWIADDGGLGYSTDGGQTFTTIRNLPVMQWTSIQSSKDGNYKILGAQDAGVQMEIDGNWHRPMGGDGLEVKVDPVDPNTLYGSIQIGLSLSKIEYNSTSNTFSVNSIISDQIVGHKATWRQKIVIHPEDRDILYTNYRDVYKTTDGGGNWDNLTNGSLGNGTTPIEYLHQSKSNPDILIIGWGDGRNVPYQMKKSTDGGQTWNASVTHPEVFISGRNNSLIIHPTDPDVMWVCGSGRIRKSTDGGVNWEDITGELPARSATCIAYQEGTPNGIYAGGNFGMLHYLDESAPSNDWVMYNNNLPNVWIQEIEVLPEINKIRVATWGRGVWESPTYTNSTDFCSEPLPPTIKVELCGTTSLSTEQATPEGYTLRWYRDGVELTNANSMSLTSAADGSYRARYLDNNGNCNSYFSDKTNVSSRPEVNVNGGEALNFDGIDDYIEVPAGVVDVGGTPFTVEFWAKKAAG